MSLSKPLELVTDTEAWRPSGHGVPKSQIPSFLQPASVPVLCLHFLGADQKQKGKGAHAAESGPEITRGFLLRARR